MDAHASRPTPRVPVPPDTRVIWIRAEPVDEEARVVWEVVTRERVTRYAALVDRVADRLLRCDLRRAGWVTDLGLLRGFYLTRAAALVRRLDGPFLRLGGPPRGDLSTHSGGPDEPRARAPADPDRGGIPARAVRARSLREQACDDPG